MNRFLKSTLTLLALLALPACGGGGGGSGFTPTYTYTIGGTISGSISGRQVLLQNNGIDDLTRTANGAFTFATQLNDGATYAVTATSPGQTCVVTGGDSGTGTGTVAAANVTSILVTCTPISYNVGVTVSGVAGYSVTLQNYSTPIAAITVDGSYPTAFPNQNSGTGYEITVLTQPTGVGAPVCTVSNGTGTVVAANINASVTCQVVSSCSSNCNVTGTLTGLQSGSITLQSTVGGVPGTIPLSANGTFPIASNQSTGTAYSVTFSPAQTNPPCSVTYGSGTVTTASISNVNVFCGYSPRGTFVATATMNEARTEHTATLLADGTDRVLVVGGYVDSTSGATNTTRLYNPAAGTWSSAGTLTTARYRHTATLLNDGTNRVLVVGGTTDGTTALGTAQIYTPGAAGTAGTWSAAASLPAGSERFYHTATLLADGKVLVAGGTNSTTVLATAFVYDPTGNSWTQTVNNLSSVRRGHTATLLTDGTNRVLVAGGWIGTGNTGLTSVDLYDPVTNSWSAGAPLTGGRYLHTATPLNDGTNRVLVAAGYNAAALKTAELYDPALNSWTSPGDLAGVRYSHTAVLLANGKVLVTGGNIGGSMVATAEIYDPAAATWSSAGSLTSARSQHAAVAWTAGTYAGNALVTGGNSGTAILATAELYDSSAVIWTATGNLTARSNHTATRLANGQVLVAGGYDGTNPMTSSQVYDTLGATASSTAGNLTTARYDHTATLITTGIHAGKVLVVGGTGGPSGTTALDSVELYDPSGGGTWTAKASLGTARSQHTATLLFDGRVLVAGGYDGISALVSAEIYDPATDSWSSVGSLATARYQHTATLLHGGKVLVAGGYSGTTSLASAEVFDPNTPAGNGVYSWSAAGTLSDARYQHTATLLPDGRVLVAGGRNDTARLATAELYTDPGAWTLTGSFTGARSQHTATLLPSGKVLVAGGRNTSTLATAVLYDTTSGTWASSISLGTARYRHAATLLENGWLLLTGGWGTGNPGSALSSAELGW